MSVLTLLDNGLSEGLLYSFVVLGLGVSFRLLRFPDLTTEGSFALGAAITATLMSNGYSVMFALFVSLGSCALAGVATAWFHIRLGMSKFLSGIITVTGLYSVMLRVMGGGNRSALKARTPFDDLTFLDEQTSGFHLGSILFLSAVAAIVVISLGAFLQTKTGLRLRAACARPEQARALGYNTTLALMAGLALSNTICGISGALFAMKSGFADVGLSQGVLITALAALTVGERLFPIKNFNLLWYTIGATLLGSIVWQSLLSLSLTLNLRPSDLKILSAGLVVALFYFNNKTNSVEQDEA